MVEIHSLVAALSRVRPLVLGHGGDVEITDVSADGVVSVALSGACRACPNIAMTFVGPVRTILMEVEGVTEVRCGQVKAGPRVLSRLAGLLQAQPYPVA